VFKIGRYISGDIDHKFWFAVQSSNDADYFGVEGSQESISYYFDKDNLKDIKKGIKTCKEKLGNNKGKLDKFFDTSGKEGYNDDMMVKFGFKEIEIKGLLEWYARLLLGEKILKCVKDNGQCSFEAEC